MNTPQPTPTGYPRAGSRKGFPHINDNAKITELIACGAHVILFSTGQGSVVGSAVSPVLKICANPATYDRMQGDMDINAGRVLRGKATLEEVGQEIVERIGTLASGKASCSEKLEHQEFVLTYKKFTPLGPAWLPQ